MAETVGPRIVSAASGVEGNEELSRLKKDIESYRELILPLNKVIEWEQSYYPAVLVGVITLMFSIVWYLEPSVLTTFCLLGVIVCATDFAVPILSAQFLRGEWTAVQERQFEAICIRLLNAKHHFTNIRRTLLILKHDKPKVYLLVMMGAFSLLAWLGSLIDNLLLTYLLVVGFALVPGLRKHGIMQKFVAKVMDKISSFRSTAPAEKLPQQPKMKAN